MERAVADWPSPGCSERRAASLPSWAASASTLPSLPPPPPPPLEIALTIVLTDGGGSGGGDAN